MEKTPKAYSNEIRKLRTCIKSAKHVREILPLELEISKLRTEAAFEATDLIIFGHMEDEQAIIDWARAAYGLEVDR